MKEEKRNFENRYGLFSVFRTRYVSEYIFHYRSHLFSINIIRKYYPHHLRCFFF